MWTLGSLRPRCGPRPRPAPKTCSGAAFSGEAGAGESPEEVSRALAPLVNLLHHPREDFNILGVVFSPIR